MTDGSISDAELAELIRRTEESASAYLRADMDRYLALTLRPRLHADAPTRPLRRPSREREGSANYFKGGEAQLELVQAHAWDDTVVLVMIERQHGQVGGLPDQDWSLRVTQVYRREGSDW